MKLFKKIFCITIATMAIGLAFFSDANVMKANAGYSSYSNDCTDDPDQQKVYMCTDDTFETTCDERTIFIPDGASEYYVGTYDDNLYFLWYHDPKNYYDTGYSYGNYYNEVMHVIIYNSDGCVKNTLKIEPKGNPTTISYYFGVELPAGTYTVNVTLGEIFEKDYGYIRWNEREEFTFHFTITHTCDHVWDSGKVTKEATETSEGEITYTCTRCGETKTKTTASLASRAIIKDFVTRLYKVCLDREPDDEGLNNWVNDLASGEKTGVDVASGFIFSTEFNNHNYCNSCYVEHLYNAFMGRASDPDGKAYWINNLETGMTREEVFNGFALSNEFKNICDEYGIVQGEGLTIPEYGTVPKGSCSADGTVDGVTSFVTRLYNVCLDRDPDAEGLNNWTNALWNHDTSGSTTAHGFIFSPEFTNKNYDDDTYVEYLYRAFFDRASDPTGKADWVSKLQNGASREEVFNGFTGSQEFMTLCAKYGIVR